MSEIEDKLSTILSNPQLMQQIMGMAQALNQNPPPSPPPKQESVPTESFAMPDIDPAMIGNIMALAGQSRIDQSQKTLLCALEPYLTKHKLHKLEKAMHASKIAGIATKLLQNGTIPFVSGR